MGHYRTQIQEIEGDFVFLHRLVTGVSEDSHGLLIAQIAGKFSKFSGINTSYIL